MSLVRRSELEVDEGDAGVDDAETLEDQEEGGDTAGVGPGGGAEEAAGPAGDLFEDGEEEGGEGEFESARA